MGSDSAAYNVTCNGFRFWENPLSANTTAIFVVRVSILLESIFSFSPQVVTADAIYMYVIFKKKSSHINICF